ncbi:MAG: ketoacyl-ACP synthase III [Chloroflexi bacterium]|nr:MAG: ketoacyl-ACP synthase III [Chloroflexota bacterium]
MPRPLSLPVQLPFDVTDRSVGPGTGVLGVGGFVPEGLITNAELEQLVDTSDRWILERTGIRERRRAGAGQTASVMGAAAARRALERAGVDGVDLILVATATPDTLVPATACLVQRRLGLGGVPALDIGAACSGFVYGLAVADGMIRSGAAGTVLLVATEAMTSLVDYGDRSTCVLFGDGAAAVVLRATGAGGIRAVRLGADGREADLIYFGPGTEPGQEGNAFRMAGRGTYRLAVDRLSELALHVCADAGWRLDEVEHIVPHQANLRIVEAAARRLGVPMERVVWNGDRLGNTSAASIPLALADADAEGRLRRGDRVVCLAFGAGATWGGVALEW